MDEYIERGLVLEMLERAAEHASCIDECREFSIRQCISTINTIPVADVAPVVYGRWIEVTKIAGVAVLKCSACGKEHPMLPSTFCRDCGAKMQEAQ